MDAILACLAELERKALAHDSEVARLSSEVEAHASANARLTAENARLSSGALETKRDVVELSLTLKEVSKTALPEGHWAWEASREGGQSANEGRWVRSHVRPSPLPAPARPELLPKLTCFSLSTPVDLSRPTPSPPTDAPLDFLLRRS